MKLGVACREFPAYDWEHEHDFTSATECLMIESSTPTLRFVYGEIAEDDYSSSSMIEDLPSSVKGDVR
jgi:hypothetical protein